MTVTTEMTSAIAGGDLDEVLVLVEHLHDRGDWAGLTALESLCRSAHEKGLTLWPAAVRARYLRALSAPGRWAATTLDGSALTQFGLGPLTEVVAQTHRWDELAAHLPVGPEAGVAAQERVLRGEDLTGDATAQARHGELPLVLANWEPRYHLPVYRAGGVDVPAPAPAQTAESVDTVKNAPSRHDPDSLDALADLVRPWVEQSAGRVGVATTPGGAAEALGALGAGPARLARLEPAEAVATMAWAAAGGGARGRRRGGAYGRFAAWWALACLSDSLDEWPLDDRVAGEIAADLEWYTWDHGSARQGWSLGLLVVDSDYELAWALEAVDPV